MKNRRFTYIYILLTVMLLGASYQLNYRDSKAEVYERINERFREEVPYWGDSIYAIRNYPSWGRYHSAAYARKTKTTVITEGDTVVISARYFLPKEYDEYQRRCSESALMYCKYYTPGISDTLFSNLLKSMGIEAEAATELYVKNQKEMFPTADSMNVNAPIREVLTARHVEGFVTDSVGIGICDQGLMVGKVAVSRHTVLAHMRWVSRWQIALILLLAAGYAVAAYCQKTVARLRSMKIIGNTCIDLDANVIRYWDGTTQPLTPTKSALLSMLADAAPDYRLLKEDICQAIWQRNAKDGQALYHVAVSELRTYLVAPDDSLTLNTLPREGIQLIIDPKRLHPHRRLHYWRRR